MTSAKANRSNPAFLFSLRYALGDGSLLTIHAFDTGKVESRGTPRLTIRAVHTGYPSIHANNQTRFSRVIWKEGQTWCSPGPSHAIDSNEAKRLVTSLVSIRPGDTDEDYFKDYTLEQRAFCETYGEELSMLSESRYEEAS